MSEAEVNRRPLRELNLEDTTALLQLLRKERQVVQAEGENDATKGNPAVLLAFFTKKIVF
jgi:hypothetical protein